MSQTTNTNQINDDVIRSLVSHFVLEGSYTGFEENRDGHINKTYIINSIRPDGSPKRYVLQMINTAIFTNPVALMENIAAVTTYLREKITATGGDADRETLTLVLTIDGKFYFVNEQGNYYRMYHYIEGAVAYQTVERPVLFRNAARAFGKFQKQLSQYPANTLAETIPHFHDTPKRFRDFREAVEADRMGRAASVQKEIDFYFARENIAGAITEKLSSGEIPLRVTHNDTKLNNIMMDLVTDEGICVIDLDTVMPGSALYDFGDSIRFGASSGAEDEKNLDAIYMKLDLYEAYTAGYLEEARGALTDAETALLPMSSILMTMECGIRFLGDYLNGDTYFSIHYPEQNLDRARTQAKLVYDMEQKYDQMMAITEKYKA